MNEIKLGSVLKIKHGYAFKTENYVPKSRFRLVTLGNFEEGNNSFKYNDSKATYYEGFFPEEVILQPMDLIMPLTEQVIGLFGNSAFIPESEDYTFVLNQRVGKVVANEKKLDKIYAHYLLATKNVKKQLEHRATGTRQRNISPNDVYDVSVILPSVNEQKRIGMLLYSIEEKQKLNNKIISELESMAKTVYDYWFLQFDFPDENGKPYKSSGGKMVYNEELKREIPEGWEVKELGKLFSITMGSSPKGECLNENGEGIEFYQGSTDFGILFPTERVYTLGPIRLADKNDILLSVRAPVGDMNIAMNRCCIGRGLAAVHCDSSLFALNTLKTLDKYFKVFNTSGTTFGALTSDGLKGQFVIAAPQELVDKYKEIVDSAEKQIRKSEKENRDLASLRDFLLPMLMNGQVTFRDNDEAK